VTTGVATPPPPIGWAPPAHDVQDVQHFDGGGGSGDAARGAEHTPLVTDAGAMRAGAIYRVSDAQPGNPTAAAFVQLPSDAAAAAPDAPISGAVAGAHVLVVDDSEANRRFAGFVLRKLGCVVAVVTDGDEVVHAVNAAAAGGSPYDLVLVDLVMVSAAMP
jgi:hypothetical protein